jgi:hypothetical protein
MYKMIFFILVLTFFSCEEKYEEIDLSEITTSSKKYNENIEREEGVSEVVSIIIPSAIKESFDCLNVKETSIIKNESSSFLDRFTKEIPLKLDLVIGEDSVIFEQWVFKDSIQSKNAFYNWLDFNKIEVNEKKSYKGSEFIIVLDVERIVMISNCNHLQREVLLNCMKFINPIFVLDNLGSNNVNWE